MDMKLNKIFHNIWFWLIFNTLTFALMAWLLPIHFEENDDIAMCMITNGHCSGTPDGHLVYINALYGWLIASLYMLTRAVEWYTLVFCALHILSVTGICYMVMNDDIRPILKCLFLIFLYVIWARIIIAFQFTTTAGLLCFSGCLALRRSSNRWRMMGLVAIFIASLVRFQAAALVGVICAPMLIADFIKERYLGYWLVGVIILVLFGKSADAFFYKSPDWAAYKTYNSVRGFINDNPNMELALGNLPEGIDEKDYQLFCSFEGDPKVMTLSRIQMIKSEIKRGLTLRKAFANMSQLQLYRIPIVLIFIGMLLSFLMNNKTVDLPQLHKPPVVFSSFVLVLLVMVYIGMTGSLKNRVFLCMLLPMTYLLVYDFRIVNGKRGKSIIIGLSMVLLGLILKYGYQDKKVISLVHSHQKEFSVLQYPLVEDYFGTLYTGEFRLEYLSPFEVCRMNYHPVGLGWMTCIPFQKGILECYRDFVDSDIAYYGQVDNPPIHILERIQKNYGISARLVTIDRNEKYALYKFISE